MTRALFSTLAASFLIVAGMFGSFIPASCEAAQDASAQEIPYLTGGVGEHEREQLEAAAKDYNLKLVFAQKGGAFVADVQLTIKNDAGAAILEATSDGPLFFAKLPAGSFVVEAVYEGVVHSKTTSLAATGQRVLDFRW